MLKKYNLSKGTFFKESFSSGKISIILPVYNTDAYLSSCLLSIQEQTYTNWECLCVDDGSTDTSLSILNTFEKNDSRFKVIKSTHQGILPSLILGWKMATGEFISRMDSDDMMPKTRLSLMFQKLKQVGKNHLVTGQIKYFCDEYDVRDGYKRYEKWLNSLKTHQDYLNNIFIECVIPSPGWMIYHSDFDFLGGFSTLDYPEDYDLAFKFLNGGMKIIKLLETVLLWRDHQERASRNLIEYQEQSFWDLKLKYFQRLVKSFLSERDLYVWGLGKKAKVFIKKCDDLGISLKGIITNNKRKIGQDYLDVPVCSENQQFNKRSFFCILVSSPLDIEGVLRQLKFKKRLEGRDFLRFCG